MSFTRYETLKCRIGNDQKQIKADKRREENRENTKAVCAHADTRMQCA